jgi:hypothetical protein
VQWPEWWKWEIEITPHIEKRMVQRGFNEIDLRTMLHNCSEFIKDREPGRYIILSKMGIMKWEIIVEPDYDQKLLVVVTAYPLEE